MSAPPKAIFLSYASQDAEAARRICDALRAVGFEVWFDQSALRGDEAWDASIRRQAKDCALFVLAISAKTQARAESYFRREWNLAASRTLDMAEDRAFRLPVVLAATLDATARLAIPVKDRAADPGRTCCICGRGTSSIGPLVRTLPRRSRICSRRWSPGSRRLGWN